MSKCWIQSHTLDTEITIMNSWRTPGKEVVTESFSVNNV